MKKKLMLKRTNNLSAQQKDKRRHIVIDKVMLSTTRDRNVLRIHDTELL